MHKRAFKTDNLCILCHQETEKNSESTGGTGIETILRKQKSTTEKKQRSEEKRLLNGITNTKTHLVASIAERKKMFA